MFSGVSLGQNFLVDYTLGVVMSSHVPQSPVGLLQHAGAQIVLIVSGGGSEVISQLLTQGGASKIILEALVPYARTAMTELLGSEPRNYCTDQVAR